MSKRNFFDTFEAHTEIKLAIYTEYLRRYLPILLHARSVESIHIYDMFCGRGYTSDGKKGSAVLGIEEVVNSVTRIGTKKEVYIHLSDCDKVNCSEISHIVSTLKLPSNITVDVSCKDFHEAVNDSNNRQTVGRINNKEKLLFFIDPYGYKDTDPRTIVDIKQNDNAEVIMFVPIRHIFRFLSSKQPNRALDKWRSFVEYHDGISEISELISAICTKFAHENFNTGYFMFVNQKSGNEYTLFFLSSNLLGLEKFNEVKWSFDRVQGTKISKDFECSVASCIEDDLHKNELSILKDRIIQEVNSLPGLTISNVDLYEYIVQNGYLPKHFNQLWKNDKFLNKKFTTSRRQGNYITYEYYSNSEILVLFSVSEPEVSL